MTRPATLATLALLVLLPGFSASAQDTPLRYRIPVTPREPSRGPEDALVTIVVFNDFECPFCSHVQPTIERLVAAHPTDVRVVFRNLPLAFHDHARLAAQAALEAFAQGGDAGFWRMHDVLFANQAALERADLERYATEQHLDLRRLQRALNAGLHTAELESDQTLARLFHVDGTPGFMINGRPLMGAQDYSVFSDLVRDELRRAKALVDAGTPRARVYAALTRDALARADERRQTETTPAVERVYALPIPPGAPTRGAAHGRVVVQQFSDFQCPFCERVEPTMDALLARYGDRVTFVWRDYPLPFHDHARPAAEAAREVRAQLGVAAFWRYHAVLMANQRALARVDLERYATALGGIDLARFRAALDGGLHRAAVQADMDAVVASGAQIGTPAFFINGHLTQGAQPLEVFTAAIDGALGAAPSVIEPR